MRRRPRQTSARGLRRNAAARIVDSTPFTVVVVATIAVNAVVLGLQTYDERRRPLGHAPELRSTRPASASSSSSSLIRIASYWPRPWEFFRNGWNIFDFVVVGATFVPGVAENSTLLRLVRLLRVVRIVRVLPDLRVLLRGVWRSVPPLASIGAVTAMILFVYGMVGWVLFADELPEQWGNIGRAMLTLFVMLTLEDFPVYMDEAMDDPPVGVDLLRELHPRRRVHRPERAHRGRAELDGGGARARAAARRSASGTECAACGAVIDPEAHAPVVERIAILRSALDELELRARARQRTRAQARARPSRRRSSWRT